MFYLVVVAYWSMAYRGEQATPALIKEMPSWTACQSVGKAMFDLSGSRAKFVCVATPKAP